MLLFFRKSFLELFKKVKEWIRSARLSIFTENEALDDIFQKIMYLVRPEHIREVWVQGEKVHSRS